MATLEDKILGNKLENYCSSSEDEQEKDDEDECKGQGHASVNKLNLAKDANPVDRWEGYSVNVRSLFK